MSKKDSSFTTIVVDNSESRDIEISAADEELIRALSKKLEKLKPYFTGAGAGAGFIAGIASAIVAAHLKGLSPGLSVSIIAGIGGLFGGGISALVARDVFKKASDNRNQEFRKEVEEKTKDVLAADLTGVAVGKKFKEIMQQYKKLDFDPPPSSSASSSVGLFTSSESSLPTSLFAGLNIEDKNPNDFTHNVFVDLQLKGIEVSIQDKKQIRLLGIKWNIFDKHKVKSSSDIHYFASAVHHAYGTGLNPSILPSIYAATRTLTSRDISQKVASIVKERTLKMSKGLEGMAEELNEQEEGILDPKLEQGRAKGKSRRDKDGYDPSVFGRTAKTKLNSDFSPSPPSSSTISS